MNEDEQGGLKTYLLSEDDRARKAITEARKAVNDYFDDLDEELLNAKRTNEEVLNNLMSSPFLSCSFFGAGNRYEETATTPKHPLTLLIQLKDVTFTDRWWADEYGSIQDRDFNVLDMLEPIVCEFIDKGSYGGKLTLMKLAYEDLARGIEKLLKHKNMTEWESFERKHEQLMKQKTEMISKWSN